MRIVSADGTGVGAADRCAQGAPSGDRWDCSIWRWTRNFANRRIFFTYSENTNDTDSHIVLASATLNADLARITGAKIILPPCPRRVTSAMERTRAAGSRWTATATCS